jgi:uncharacterized protein (TIGR00297 family)
MSELSPIFSLPYTKFFLGLSLAILVAALAWQARALSSSGAWAAAVTGTVIFGLGGIPWAALLLTFFFSSSLLSKAFAQRKAALNEKFSKGSQRDWEQVLANGGLGIVLVLMSLVFPEKEWIWIAYAGALSAVNADTWATEIGVLSRTLPRLITTGARVESGTSGGITPLGSLAAFLGSSLVSVVALFVMPTSNAFLLVAAATWGGFGGSLVDSLLGASVQGIYTCPACQKETERFPKHSCGTETIPLRGWRWVNNELVNFTCSLAGAVLAVIVWILF